LSAYDIIEERLVPNTSPDEWIKQKCELRKEKIELISLNKKIKQYVLIQNKELLSHE